MHILHLTNRSWPAYGGAERYLLEISAWLAAQGHQVTLATTTAVDLAALWDPQAPQVAPGEEMHRGVRLVRFPVHYLPGTPRAFHAVRRLLWLLARVPGVPLALSHRLSRLAPHLPALDAWLATYDEPVDLVAAMNIVFDGIPARGRHFAARRGAPFVLYPLAHLGAGPAPGVDAPSRYYTMPHQIDLVTRSDAVVAITPTERNFWVGRGLAPARVRVVPGGVDPAEQQGGQGPRLRERHGLVHPIVAFLSAMAYDKGAMTTVDAMRILWQEGRQVDLVMAGTALPEFRAYVDGLSAEEQARIRILHAIPEAEKQDLLDACTLLTVPSRVDSFGIAYLEAWCYGKPVVGAQTWGVNDVIDHGRNGLLAPFGDAAALARAFAQLLDDPELAARFGRQGREKLLQHYTWAQSCAAVGDLYAELSR